MPDYKKPRRTDNPISPGGPAISAPGRDGVPSEFDRESRTQNDFARRLIDCFPDLVIAIDLDGRCTFAGPRCLQLLGFGAEELAGGRFSEHVDSSNRAEFDGMRESVRLTRGEAPFTADFLLEAKSGEMRLFRTTASPLINKTGRPEGLILSLRDVTESRRIEQQVNQSERLAAMGQMVAGAAHELNNPLTAVLGVTELLKDSIKDESLQRQLDLAYGQARRAAQIVQSLLAFARPAQPRKVRLQLGDVIERSLQFQERSLRAGNITVDFVRQPEAAAVLGDAGQLTQVVLNLVINAEQAIREARDHGTIRIGIRTEGDKVVATFQDDGAGIRRDVLPKIFDPFFTTKRPGRGAGLGLSICAAILREHQGDIEAQPLAGGGSIFTLSLPVAQGDEPIFAESVFSRPTAVSSGALSGCSLLVVDDEEGIREMVRDGISSRGARVDVASSGEEALCLMESRSYDVVLCDLNLKPVVPSAISARELFARASRLTVADRAPAFILMTGELAEANGIDDTLGRTPHTLQKPFTISALAKLLAELAAETTANLQPVRAS
jgi:PAS domain S-box-containing protein